jgi:Zn-dependent protease
LDCLWTSGGTALPYPVMRWSFPIGSLFGIPVRVHLALALLLLFVVIIAPPKLNVVQLVMTAIMVFASVLAHELGHALAAKRHGIETRSIVLHPLGGAAVLSERPKGARAELQIAFAGPLVSLLLSGLGFIGFALSGLEFFEHLAWPNLLIGAFNLLPAFPLDGGRMLRALLELRVGSRRATRWAAIIGRILASGLFVVGLALTQPMLSVVGAFIFLAGAAEERSHLIHDFISSQSIHQAMEGVSAPLPAGGDVADALRMLLENPQLPALPVTFGSRVIGVIHRQPLLSAATSGPQSHGISEVLDRNIVTQDGDGPLIPLLQRMGESQSRAAVVMQDGEVRGVITVDRLVEALKRLKT